MSRQLVTLQHDAGVATLTLAAPRLSRDACATVLPLVRALAEDEAVRVVVIRGALWPLPPEQPGPEAVRAVRELVEAVAALPMPVLAVLNGQVVAEGLELALAADLRLASDTATFAMPHLIEGRMPACGGTQRLPRLVGLSAAYALLLGETWDAARAEALGLVSAVAPQAGLDAEVARWTARLAEKAPLAARFLKESVRRGLDVSLDQGLLIEEDLYLLLQTTDDRKEGIRAFLEKRKAAFTGK
jgi:enoyl-CoA hydratase